MRVFIYCADIYCEDCGRQIRRDIKESTSPTDLDLIEREDSDSWPQGPYPDGGGEADCPQHCGSHGECLNAITLEDGTKIGAMLDNPLTIHGIEYVKEAIKENKESGRGNKEVLDLWVDHYGDELSCANNNFES